MRPSYALSGTTVFLGAFLLFVIEPIVGKELLPLFGGSSSVWAVSLLFFTGTLFVGYLYVYALTKLSSTRQAVIHLGVVGISVAISFFAFFGAPAAHGFFGLEDLPALDVLATLLLLIGAPFFLLSTTAPLVQYWYSSKDADGGESRRRPYTLYALSNTASLAALLSYPFLIEPVVARSYQESIWGALFLVYAFLSTVIATRALKGDRGGEYPENERESERGAVSFRGGIILILLAALPSFVLVATTTHITQAIAPVPLLWIVPLALYLSTFIIAFSGRGQSLFTPFLFLVSALAAGWFTPAPYDQILAQVAAYLLLLFFCGLSCHVLIYRMKPANSSSPLFYVYLSFGGAVGVLLASIVAPFVFTDFWEHALGLALSGALAMVILPKMFFPRILGDQHILIVRILFLAVAVFFFARFILPDESVPYLSTRNFYGNAKVLFGSNVITLRNGTTIHGSQYVLPEDAHLPTTYFTPGSGVGRSILYEQHAQEGKLRVGVIGLGVGTISAYCRPEDTYVFYEIDSRIELIARSYFSYLAHCAGAEARIGDGRVLLKKELEAGSLGRYDVLAVDAFTDDTIPVHLLTLQAFKLYTAHLRSPESILAIHISNRYLNLAPVVFRIAAELGLSAMLVSDDGESDSEGSASEWVVLSKDPEVFTSVAFANANVAPSQPSSQVWTDDYSSLFPVLDIEMPWH